MPSPEHELRGSLEESLARHRVPGASAAIFHDGSLITAAAGVLNVTTGVAVTPETVMHVGSIAKVLTATLVMQLVDEGKVDLDERVLRYLPGLRLKDREALAAITVRMLLNHTSGIDGTMLPDHGHDEETIEKAIGRFAQLGQVHRPGAEYSYCNAASVIAGYLVQRLSGKSWYRLIRERIFLPLQMEHAATLPEEALLHRSSVGHHLDAASGKVVRTSFAFLPLSFAPCGTTLMMSATDLIAFARAHMAFGVGANAVRILSESSARAMQQTTVDNRGKGYTLADGVGIGWMLYESGVLHHGGGGPGIAAVLYVDPQRELAAAILTNAAHSLALIEECMAPWLETLGVKFFGRGQIPVTSTPADVDSAQYCGTFENLVHRFRVVRTPGGLALSRQIKYAYYDHMSTQATAPARLTPIGGDLFLLDVDAKDADPSAEAFRLFAFRNPDASGRMQHLGNIGRLYPRVE